MSSQLRGQRSGLLWLFILSLVIAALAIGYFFGAQRPGSSLFSSAAQVSASPTWTPIVAATSAAIAIVTLVDTPTAAATATPDLAMIQTVVAAQLASAMAATLTAQPTPDQAATATSEAERLNMAVVATLAAQPSATPTVQPTNSPTATSDGIGSNPLLVAVPELVAPESGYTIIGNAEASFAWKWVGRLEQNQAFEILLWPLGRPEDKRGIHDAHETQTLTPDLDGVYRLRKNIPNRGEGHYEWTVAIIQLDAYQRFVEAAPRSIKITSSALEELLNGCPGVVQTQLTSLREGPGIYYPPINKVRSGDHLLLIGRTESSSWFKVQMSDLSDGDESWIRADLIAVQAGCTLPEIEPASATSTP